MQAGSPHASSASFTCSAAVRTFSNRVPSCRIEVDHEEVGLRRRRAAGVPGMQLDRAEVRHPRQRRRVLDAQERQLLRRLDRRRAGRHPRRALLRSALHVEALSCPRRPGNASAPRAARRGAAASPARRRDSSGADRPCSARPARPAGSSASSDSSARRQRPSTSIVIASVPWASASSRRSTSALASASGVPGRLARRTG